MHCSHGLAADDCIVCLRRDRDRLARLLAEARRSQAIRRDPFTGMTVEPGQAELGSLYCDCCRADCPHCTRS